MSALLQLDNVTFPGRLGPLTASVEQGVWLHLVGPNGSGKSTLLALVAGLVTGEGGIVFAGQPLNDYQGEALARRRGWLAQHQTPPFAMPVWHYLSLHQKNSRGSQELAQIVKTLQLTDKLTRPVNQLSGGEWQRVRLAAVILQIHPAVNPHGKLLLLDEPMNSLDVAQQAALDRLLLSLCETGITVIMSSHDINHTLRYAHRVWLLRNGKLVAEGERDNVLTAERLEQTWDVPFRQMNVDNQRFLWPC